MLARVVALLTGLSVNLALESRDIVARRRGEDVGCGPADELQIAADAGCVVIVYAGAVCEQHYSRTHKKTSTLLCQNRTWQVEARLKGWLQVSFIGLT